MLRPSSFASLVSAILRDDFAICLDQDQLGLLLTLPDSPAFTDATLEALPGQWSTHHRSVVHLITKMARLADARHVIDLRDLSTKDRNDLWAITDQIIAKRGGR